jgi:hypothetical protein
VDWQEALNTIVSLTLLVFILWAMRDIIKYFAALWNLTGVVSFLS